MSILFYFFSELSFFSCGWDDEKAFPDLVLIFPKRLRLLFLIELLGMGENDLRPSFSPDADAGSAFF
ncbi:MAG: hypothetical protein IKM52_04100, partial [Clostridia bacterium]|nr:hypothetical protein [Clostridia bacterium]